MEVVKRAIIMAAGIGSRMQPVTFSTPKPLVEVNGVRMIDTVIQGLLEHNITEIYVVVGYLKDQFKSLKTDYPMITLVENPWYDTCNNISSLYVVRDFISNAIILDGDQMIYNKDVLVPSIEYSGYNSVWIEEATDEWLQVVENNRVISCSRTGGDKGWRLYSISRWTKEDGVKLKKHLELEFEEKKHTQLYWDDVVMFQHFNDYQLGVYPMNGDDVVEIDSLDELIESDARYKKFKEN